MPEIEHNVELMSEEAQEVMNRIPPSIQRWGISIIGIIIATLIVFASTVKIPLTDTCNFKLEWDNNDHPDITLFIPSSSIQSVVNGNNNIVLMSEAFPEKFDFKIDAKIYHICNSPIQIDNNIYYVAKACLSSTDEKYLMKLKINFMGTAVIAKGHTPIIKQIMK